MKAKEEVDEIPTESKELNRKGRWLKFASIVGKKSKGGFGDSMRAWIESVICWERPCRWNWTTFASMEP
jgi:hypothetical protein